MSQIKSKLIEFKEIIMAAVAIIAVLVGFIFWAQDVILEREEKIIQRNADLLSSALIERIKTEIDPISSADLAQVMRHQDSLNHEMISLGADYFLRQLMRQDTMMIEIKKLSQTDRQLDEKINAIQITLDKIRGITTGTNKHLRETALTDSLQNELNRIKNEQERRAILRQMEDLHRIELQRIRDLSQDVVIDKGRKKTIRSTPKRTKSANWGKN